MRVGRPQQASHPPSACAEEVIGIVLGRIPPHSDHLTSTDAGGVADVRWDLQAHFANPKRSPDHTQGCKQNLSLIEDFRDELITDPKPLIDFCRGKHERLETDAMVSVKGDLQYRKDAIDQPILGILHNKYVKVAILRLRPRSSVDSSTSFNVARSARPPLFAL
jgi:hypothetical protein